MTFAAAMEALTADAVRWDGVADATGQAADAAGGLVLDSTAFSFAGHGVAAAYASLRTTIEQVLRGGEAELHGAATTLRQVRATYEGTDEAARRRLGGVWDWD